MSEEQRKNDFVLPEIKEIVDLCLEQLLTRDEFLLQHDASERSITHKLAECLQLQFKGWYVDCEYNRNVEVGLPDQKLISVTASAIRSRARRVAAPDKLLELSTYPDIVVHNRTPNSHNENLLVIEVKKQNGEDFNFDHAKLKEFTKAGTAQDYRYKFGLFILLDTGHSDLKRPELTWFIDGDYEPAPL